MSKRRGPGRPFTKGHKPAYTRKKGTRNKRTIVREYIGLGKEETLKLFEEGSKKLDLAPRHERIAALLNGSQSVAAPLERELMLHSWGHPKGTLELSGSLGIDAIVREAYERARGRKP